MLGGGEELVKVKARRGWIKLYQQTGDAGLVCRCCGISRPTLRKKRLHNTLVREQAPSTVDAREHDGHGRALANVHHQWSCLADGGRMACSSRRVRLRRLRMRSASG
jgi:hypothetical protein